MNGEPAATDIVGVDRIGDGASVSVADFRAAASRPTA
jgi:hypothetical protein